MDPGTPSINQSILALTLLPTTPPNSQFMHFDMVLPSLVSQAPKLIFHSRAVIGQIIRPKPRQRYASGFTTVLYVLVSWHPCHPPHGLKDEKPLSKRWGVAGFRCNKSFAIHGGWELGTHCNRTREGKQNENPSTHTRQCKIFGSNDHALVTAAFSFPLRSFAPLFLHLDVKIFTQPLTNV